jgi:hypothetical protein
MRERETCQELKHVAVATSNSYSDSPGLSIECSCVSGRVDLVLAAPPLREEAVR